MFRALLAVVWWTLYVPAAAIIGFPAFWSTGKVDLMYRMAMWGALAGVRLAGVKVEVLGRERFDPAGTYIYMCNHTSNLDPPIVVPVIPRRTSVLVKKELFRIPILAQAMLAGELVPVDRRNREAAVASVQRAAEVMKKGVNMTIFPEGTRSRDGRLLPFKKGPFYLALETGYPIVPMTIVNTHDLWPKGKFAVSPGTATVVFHDPIDPKLFSDREALTLAVREKIESGLPEKYRS